MDAPTAQRRRSSRPGPGRPRNSHATGAAHYLGKLAPTPLLTAEEELSLARSLQRLLELRRLHEELEEELKRRPSAGEVAASLGLPAPEVVRQLREGEAARERMLVANLRLVVSIAKRFMGKGLPFDDLVQEGNLGLIRAAEGFDPVRRLKFSTYATYWIRQRICRAIADQSRVIRIPAYLHDRLLAMRRESDKFQALTGRVPTDSELANLIGVKDAKFSDMHLIPSVVSMEARLSEWPSSTASHAAALRPAVAPCRPQLDCTLSRLIKAVVCLTCRSNISCARFARTSYPCLSAPTRPTLAHTDCNEDDGRTIDTVLTDTVEQDTMLDTTLLRAELESVLTSELPPLERDVLRLRYGLDDGVVKSMVYVGKIAGLKPIKVSRRGGEGGGAAARRLHHVVSEALILCLPFRALRRALSAARGCVGGGGSTWLRPLASSQRDVCRFLSQPCCDHLAGARIGADGHEEVAAAGPAITPQGFSQSRRLRVGAHKCRHRRLKVAVTDTMSFFNENGRPCA